ncbi:MAG: hypothetical protein HKM04_07305 [Legionellales bacterium]|nr:hypothetical protein [Legionellales bacterium]
MACYSPQTRTNFSSILSFFASKNQLSTDPSFIKKTQKTPKKELDLAKARLKEVKKDDKR